MLHLFMSKPLTAQSLGIQKNKLNRYKLILDYWATLNTEDIHVTVLHKKYIYPKFFISRATLYEVLRTPVTKELKEIERIEQQQFSLF